MPDCALAANACAAACTLWCCVWLMRVMCGGYFCYKSVNFLLREGVYLVTGEQFLLFREVVFLLRESAFLVTGGRHFCRTNKFFYLP